MTLRAPHIIIVANGSLNKDIARHIGKNDFVIGVDRAAYWLLEHRIIPDVAVGDFDSCTKPELQKIQKHIHEVLTFPPEKNFTDIELAFEEALKRNPKDIIVYGAIGTRMDHTLGALGMLEKAYNKKIHAVIRDEANEVSLVGRGRTMLEKREGSRYVSVISVTDTIVISLKGMKYPLKHHSIRRGETIGISNEFLKHQAEVTIHKGQALIIQSSD